MKMIRIGNLSSLVLAVSLMGTASRVFGVAPVFTEDFNDNDISDWTPGCERVNSVIGDPGIDDSCSDPVAAGGVVQLHGHGSCFQDPFDGVAATLTKTISLADGTYLLSYQVSHSTTHYDFCQGGTGGDSGILVNGVPIAPVSCTVNNCGTCTVPTTTVSGCFTVSGGSVELKLRTNSGDCADSTGVFDNITIVAVGNKCPLGLGYWKTHPAAWPVTSLTLGTVTYTQAQLLAILKTNPGAGSKADASLILADQLISAKLNIANGSNPCSIDSTVAASDALIGGRTIPITPRITPTTGDGPQMISLAATLEQYNSGQSTPGCTP